MNFHKAVDSVPRLFLLLLLVLPLSMSAQDSLPSAMVERYISPFQVHYGCIPVMTTPARVFSRFTVSYYLETQHMWKAVRVNDSLLNSPMLGYSIWSSTTDPDSTIIYYTGFLNTGIKSIALTRTWNASANPPSWDGWNLCGNPYPSASDFESTAWSLSNVDPAIYFFDGVNYRPYNRVDHIGNGTRIIPSGQGFFVHVTSGSSGSMAVDNSTRVHSLQPFYKNTEILSDLLTLEADGNGFSDETFIRLDSAAMPHFDAQTDAYKLFGIAQAPQIYSLVGDTLASINVLPYAGENTIVPLGFREGVSGTYSIISHGMGSFSGVGTIFLKDAKINYWQNLMLDSTYSFTSDPSDDPNRFFIYFNYVPAGVQEDNGNAGFRIYSGEEYLYVRNTGNQNVSGNVFVYDLIGRLVFSDMLQNIPVNRFRTGVKTGYYLVRVTTATSTLIRKIFLR